MVETVMDPQRKRPTLFACSGASNVGELADRACRRVAAKGIAEMLCLTRLCTGDEAVVQGVREAPFNVMVDGCGEACGRKNFERLGIHNVHYVCVTGLGIEKRGDAPVTEELVENLAGYLQSLVAERA